jgi:hypothetical protein
LGRCPHERFEKIALYKEDQFPPELSWRHRDCAEPLLQIADFIGGDWPQRARQALVTAFALAAFEDFYSSRQILSDIRDLFAAKDNPEWISTTDLLEFLHTLDSRAWDTWSKDKPMQPKALAHLLEPFGIQPRNHRTVPKTVPKGYYREDLEPIWRRHLEPPGTAACPRGVSRRTPGCGEGSEVLPVAADSQNPVPNDAKLRARSQKLTASPVAANAQNLSPAISGQQLEASSQKLTRPVAANLQTSVPKLGASSQKLAASPSRPMWGADWLTLHRPLTL